MKSIPRTRPPPAPIGIRRCDEGTLGRWEADSFRFPPYHYMTPYIIWQNDTWRLLEASERELLLGFGFGHTSLCWGATAIKGDLQGFEDKRKSLLGDSFSMLSFATVLACSVSWDSSPFSVTHLVQRLGLAPGFCTGWSAVAPIARRLQFGHGSFDWSPEFPLRELNTSCSSNGPTIRGLMSGSSLVSFWGNHQYASLFQVAFGTGAFYSKIGGGAMNILTHSRCDKP